MQPLMLLVTLLSFAFDYLGEPPRFHPVAGLGKYLLWVKSLHVYVSRPAILFCLGLALLVFGCIGVGVIVGTAQRGLGLLPFWLSCVLSALVLKPSFSLFALLRAGAEVRGALESSNLSKARHLLGYHLVSRDTQDLSESEVAGAAIESLAENLCDSVVAPLFYFLLFGLAGAWVYRFVNTADAVLGYRTGRLEYLGKSAARLDDLLNLVPARLTTTLLCLSAPLVAADAKHAWQIAWRDAANTPSPNAGWTMAAVAGGLNLKLNKRDTYSLNTLGKPPNVEALRRTQRWLLAACGLGFLLAVLISLSKHYA